MRLAREKPVPSFKYDFADKTACLFQSTLMWLTANTALALLKPLPAFEVSCSIRPARLKPVAHAQVGLGSLDRVLLSDGVFRRAVVGAGARLVVRGAITAGFLHGARAQRENRDRGDCHRGDELLHAGSRFSVLGEGRRLNHDIGKYFEISISRTTSHIRLPQTRSAIFRASGALPGDRRPECGSRRQAWRSIRGAECEAPGRATLAQGWFLLQHCRCCGSVAGVAGGTRDLRPCAVIAINPRPRTTSRKCVGTRSSRGGELGDSAAFCSRARPTSRYFAARPLTSCCCGARVGRSVIGCIFVQHPSDRWVEVTATTGFFSGLHRHHSADRGEIKQTAPMRRITQLAKSRETMRWRKRGHSVQRTLGRAVKWRRGTASTFEGDHLLCGPDPGNP